MNEPELRFKADDGSEFPEWEHSTLGELGQVSMCKRILKDQTTNDGEIPFYKIGTFGDKADAFISRELFEEYKKKYPYPEIGNILISASGSIGRTVEYTGADEYFQDSNIVWLAHDGRVLDGYLKCFYSIINWNGVEGSTIKRLYNKIILDTSIDLPCIEEQQKISGLFSALDNVIDSVQKEVDSWEQMKRGVMQKLFSQEVRFKADDGSEFPEWETKKLGDISEIIMGQSPESSSYNDAGDGILLVQGNADVKERKTVPTRWTSKPTKIANEGDIIMSIRAPVGAISKATMQICIGRGVCAIRTLDQIIQEYVYQYLMFNEDSWDKESQGGTFTAVNGKDIKNKMLLLPCTEEQQKIADCLSEFDSVIEKTKQKLEKYKQLKKGLMQRMFV